MVLRLGHGNVLAKALLSLFSMHPLLSPKSDGFLLLLTVYLIDLWVSNSDE